jgi:hypothetical protein
MGEETGGTGGRSMKSVCARCESERSIAFYCGKRVTRCGCYRDHRSPVEIRRDAVLDKYGNDPTAYTPAVLAELARDGLFDIAASFCPAGRLSMDDTKAREAATIIRDSGEAA